MLLVIDVGNTNTVAGIYDGKKLIDNWRFSSDRSKTADEFGMFMTSMLGFAGLKKEQVTDIIISSVVPPVLVPLCHMCERYFNIKPLIVGQGLKIGLQLRYENPKEIGADRIVNAVAAYDKYAHLKKPMIIIDFGTATTFCALLPGGEYLGGAICPGIGISSEALFQRTAKLPRIELIPPKKSICGNTVEAMRAGIMFGYYGLIKEIVARMKDELGGDALVIATGGFGNTMAQGTDCIDEVDPMLTLEGLRIIFEKNKK
ncbi:MAG: type III pantothenate kinase [Acidaminococcaceae bacterium]|jgi:type III pantothenate kinase|nr:type III pantothenate kinase [Acidaminococcaceae bacterium]MBP3294970.1 type III pantothenate kinase [Lachnospiraceae bacterium]MEE3405325.1 type III pantothenate kinase [Acutalibacteraceae bacterium]MBO5605765.1 type III pantothenate kinase [Acidaminococcaceae bacterium]MBO6182873.1 type III pantothenate kinase [Acidaminococcaceae bacterium]